MRKNRWVHHTSFLWDYKPENMDALLLPQKRPAYRGERPHEAFLCRLHHYGADPQTRIDQLQSELVKPFYIRAFDRKSLEKRPHRQATSLLDLRATP
jgi:lipoate-protein ligase A